MCTCNRAPHQARTAPKPSQRRRANKKGRQIVKRTYVNRARTHMLNDCWIVACAQDTAHKTPNTKHQPTTARANEKGQACMRTSANRNLCLSVHFEATSKTCNQTLKTQASHARADMQTCLQSDAHALVCGNGGWDALSCQISRKIRPKLWPAKNSTWVFTPFKDHSLWWVCQYLLVVPQPNLKPCPLATPLCL